MEFKNLQLSLEESKQEPKQESKTVKKRKSLSSSSTLPNSEIKESAKKKRKESTSKSHKESKLSSSLVVNSTQTPESDVDKLLKLRVRLQKFLQQESHVDQDYERANVYMSQAEALKEDYEMFKVFFFTFFKENS